MKIIKIFLLIFIKKNGNEYEFIDWTRIFDQELACGLNFNSRFPPLNISSNTQSISGQLKYAMVSYGFETVLNNQTFKLKIRIKDRSLNNSNLIETQDLTLNSIMSDN